MSHKSRLNDPLKEATTAALKRLIDPLVDLLFDAGVTVREFNHIARERAVRMADRRVLKELGRSSNSRVAIITGLPRSEIARILKSDDVSVSRRLGQHPARKLLSAWFDDPRFLTASGDPAILPIFGKRRSFERLVATHSRGIPVRAMLDQLTQIDALDRLEDQRVKVKSRIPLFTGMTCSSIEAIGERTRDLLDTLTNNLRHTSSPFFEGTALMDETNLEMVSLLRREINEQGANFINSVNSLFSRSPDKRKQLAPNSSRKYRLGVTVYYFQEAITNATELKRDKTHFRRKNLQRQQRPANKKSAARITARSAVKGQS